MAPSTPQSNSISLLSWPSPDLSSIELKNPIVHYREGSKRASSSRAVQAGCVKKVRKRKSRAKPKSAIKELLAADVLTFREMVHELTGAEATSPPRNSCPSLQSSSASEALLAGVLAQTLRAVDTISALLLQRATSQNSLMIQDEVESSSFLQALKQTDTAADTRENGSSLQQPGSMSCNSSSCASPNMYAGRALNMLSGLPTNIIHLQPKQDKLGLLVSLLLKQIVSHSMPPIPH